MNSCVDASERYQAAVAWINRGHYEQGMRVYMEGLDDFTVAASRFAWDARTYGGIEQGAEYNFQEWLFDEVTDHILDSLRAKRGRIPAGLQQP